MKNDLLRRSPRFSSSSAWPPFSLRARAASRRATPEPDGVTPEGELRARHHRPDDEVEHPRRRGRPGPQRRAGHGRGLRDGR
ncbi:MAG: hypothetical protein M0C28_12600 [Candidatus Moduliflexus flocculans]|nr:hypothetical protein [Candidatus Moduliflexus flocculans]